MNKSQEAVVERGPLREVGFNLTLLSRAYKLLVVTLIISGGDVTILGDPGAVSRDDTMFVVKVKEHYIVPTNCPWVSKDDGHVSKGLEINKFKNLIG